MLSIYDMDAGPRTPGNLKNSRSFFILLWKSRCTCIFSVASPIGSICKVFHILFKPLEFYSHSAIGTTIWVWHHFKISDECQSVMEVCFEKGVWNPVSIGNVAKEKLHPIQLSFLLNPCSIMNVTDKINIHYIMTYM